MLSWFLYHRYPAHRCRHALIQYSREEEEEKKVLLWPLNGSTYNKHCLVTTAHMAQHRIVELTELDRVE